MDKDFLVEYAKSELAQASAAFALLSKTDSPKSNLRSLYGITKNPREGTAAAKFMYAESGGLSNDMLIPGGASIIMPIFPWTEAELQKAVGPISALRREIDKGRIIPVIQDPIYYQNCDHLDFLFTERAPSYFIRGLFVYAALLNLPPTVMFTEQGLPVLSDIGLLMEHCERSHEKWLNYCLLHKICWEYRYAAETKQDAAFLSRVRCSLTYRYASVAICIGPENADELIKIFEPEPAAKLFLHLHIFFDHVACHGLGSDFVVRPDTSGGNDFVVSKQSGVLRRYEFDVINGVQVPLPKTNNPYVRALLREEHFFREINLSLVDAHALPEIQARLYDQIAAFNRKAENRLRGANVIKYTAGLTLYLASAADASTSGASGKTVADLATAMKIPALADWVAIAMTKLHRNNLASYVFSELVPGN